MRLRLRVRSCVRIRSVWNGAFILHMYLYINVSMHKSMNNMDKHCFISNLFAEGMMCVKIYIGIKTNYPSRIPLLENFTFFLWKRLNCKERFFFFWGVFCLIKSNGFKWSSSSHYEIFIALNYFTFWWLSIKTHLWF